MNLIIYVSIIIPPPPKKILYLQLVYPAAS